MVAGDASDARQGKRAGERVGKMEELTTNPFVRSIWAEEDRGSGSTKKGGARTVLPWRSTVEGRFRPGKARARLMEVWRRCEEWLGGLSWKGSMNGSRRWPGRRRERAPLGSVWRRKKIERVREKRAQGVEKAGEVRMIRLSLGRSGFMIRGVTRAPPCTAPQAPPPPSPPTRRGPRRVDPAA